MMRALVLSGLLAVAPVAVLSSGSCPGTGGKSEAMPGHRPEKGQAIDVRRPRERDRRKHPRPRRRRRGRSLALPATSYLGDELLKMLDCKEQQQAAKATDQAIRGGVGTEVSWKSESRAQCHRQLQGHRPGSRPTAASA